MKKNSHDQIETIDVDPFYEKVTDFIEVHKKNISYVGIALLACILLSQWYFSSKGSSDLKSYHTADQVFTKLMNAPMDQGFYDQLTTLIKQHPDLKTKYQAELVQLDIIKKNDRRIKEEVSELLNRTAFATPQTNKNFVQTTLLMEQDNLKAGLENSESLEKELSQSGLQPLLRGYNLLRVAFILKANGDAQGAKSRFEQFQKEVGEKERRQLESLFQVGLSSLDQYF